MKTIKVKFGKAGLEQYRAVSESINGDALYKFLKRWISKSLNVTEEWMKNEGIDYQLRYIVVPALLEKLKERKVPEAIELTVNEAVPALKSMAKRAEVSKKDAERYWKETKKDYLERTGKSEKELTDKDYKYIMGVVKKRMGLPTKKVKDSYERKELCRIREGKVIDEIDLDEMVDLEINEYDLDSYVEKIVSKKLKESGYAKDSDDVVVFIQIPLHFCEIEGNKAFYTFDFFAYLDKERAASFRKWGNTEQPDIIGKVRISAEVDDVDARYPNCKVYEAYIEILHVRNQERR